MQDGLLPWNTECRTTKKVEMWGMGNSGELKGRQSLTWKNQCSGPGDTKVGMA